MFTGACWFTFARLALRRFHPRGKKRPRLVQAAIDAAIMVTTPQQLSLVDVEKGIRTPSSSLVLCLVYVDLATTMLRLFERLMVLSVFEVVKKFGAKKIGSNTDLEYPVSGCRFLTNCSSWKFFPHSTS